MVSAGSDYTVLLRSDGCAVAIGCNEDGQCDIPPLDDGMAYTQISAGSAHAVLLRSDGSPLPEPGIRYVGGFDLWQRLSSTARICGRGWQYCHADLPVGDLSCGRDLVLQLELVGEDDAVTLICSTLVGEELFRLTAQGADSAWEAHKRIARKLNANLPNLHLVLPDGQLLAKFCRINPGASVAEVTQRTSRTSNSHSRWTITSNSHSRVPYFEPLWRERHHYSLKCCFTRWSIMVNNPLQARSSDCLKVRTVKQHVDILMCSKKKVSTNGPTKLVISSMTTIDSVRFRGPMLLSHLNGKRESLGC